MNKYEFFSYDNKAALLVVEAENILEADKVFTLKTGINPCKTPNIGVSVCRL